VPTCATGGVPAVPLRLLHIAEQRREPGRSHRQRPTAARQESRRHPSSPACHASTATRERTGQIPCPRRHFWEVVGNPLGWRARERQAEEARQHRDGHHEPPGADNTGATNSREARSCPAPAPTAMNKPGATRQTGTRRAHADTAGSGTSFPGPCCKRQQKRNGTGEPAPCHRAAGSWVFLPCGTGHRNENTDKVLLPGTRTCKGVFPAGAPAVLSDSFPALSPK